MRLKPHKPESAFSAALGFLFPCCAMLLLMLVGGYCPFGSKKAMLYSDSYHQYYPFFLYLRRVLRSGGSLLYSWDIGMGVDFLGLTAYYLGSPLNLISVLLPESWMLGYFCLLVPIKLGLAGLFFTIFLRRIFGRRDLTAALFGSWYALCAWSLGYQWNIMWLDTFALLPLVMLGMYALLRERKFLLYTLALALAVAANYYIGLFVCYFVFLVFFCYEICRWQGVRRFFTDLTHMAVFSVLALGLTAFITVPAVLSLQGTQSAVNQFPTGFRLNIASSSDLIGLLDGMRQVAGNLGGGTEPSFKEGLPNVYTGVGTLMLAFLFLLSGHVKLRDKLCCSVLLVFFVLSFLIRQLDYIWHGFHFTNMIPYRFSFLLSFVLLYMAYRAWLLRKSFDRLQVTAAACLSAAVFACSNDLLTCQTLEIAGISLEIPVYPVYNGAFLLLCFTVFFLQARRFRPREDSEEELRRVRRLFRRRHRRCRTAFCLLLAAELAAAVVNFGCWFPATSISNYPKGTEDSAAIVRIMNEREEDGAFFRAETTHSQTLNDGALNGYAGVSAFTSSANVRITEFMKALGYGAKNTYNRYCYEESSPVANLFLNLKYMIDRDGKDKSSFCFTELIHVGSTSLYQNSYYLPLGFMTEETLADLDFSAGNDSFDFQNSLFRAATGLGSDVWHTVPMSECEVTDSGVTVSDIRSSGCCSYDSGTSGGNVIYSFRADSSGFACIRLDFPKRNDFYVSVNGTELYRETISLPQMLAVGDVQEGDIIDIRIVCNAGETGTLNVSLGILDNGLFAEGYDLLNASVMHIESFSDTRVAGSVTCADAGLLYTSVPQNGNWHILVDGAESEITLVGDCMIGVRLSAGTHTVTFVYENKAFTAGCIVSLISAVLIFGIRFLPRRRRAAPEAISETSEEQPVVLPTTEACEPPRELLPSEEPVEKEKQNET